jgi:hypothetical protein
MNGISITGPRIRPDVAASNATAPAAKKVHNGTPSDNALRRAPLDQPGRTAD